MANEELAARARSGDKDAESVLWENVYRLIQTLTRRYLTQCAAAGIEPDDMMQECWIGLRCDYDENDSRAAWCVKNIPPISKGGLRQMLTTERPTLFHKIFPKPSRARKHKKTRRTNAKAGGCMLLKL